MSSRFPPAHDSRYVPRTRSRSPPRYQEWRPPGPSNPGFSNRHDNFSRGLDPPRGPKTFNDAPRGPPSGPGAGPSAPLGPRGRGAPPRPEFRELRDAPPLGTDRSFREREFDRRPRPTSPRARSPVRGFRDGPLPPRELDLGRGRRDSRDGPIPAGSNYSDPPSFGQSPFGRGGFNGRGRGRGRGDFGFRDRRGPADDRNTFRPRDRSPPTRWGSVSRTDRDDWRPERRDDDRWAERDDREREPDRFRRDPASSRFDSRPPTPHQQAPLLPSPADRAPPFESSRDDTGMRRPSTTSLSGAKEPLRRDTQPQSQPPPMPLPPNDLLAGRVESSAARYGPRTSSPPPSAPQVPAFGSLSFKSQPYSGPTSNVWKASPESRAPAVPAKAPVPSSPVPKTAPTAPKAQLAAPPPAAPRAPRALEGGPPTAPRETPLDRTPSAPKARNSSAPQPPVPTAPWALRTDERSTAQFAPPAVREGRSLSGSFPPNVNNAPTSPRNSGAPLAQMAQMKPVEPSTGQAQMAQMQPSVENNIRDNRPPRADMAPPRLGTPPPTAPSGPRNTHSFSMSPVLPSPNVPTAPKAIRGPPIAPRASVDRGPPPNRPMERNAAPSSRAPPGAPRAPAWNQWIRPGAPQYREPVVPAKRDANGDEKFQQSMQRASPQNMHRRTSDPSSMRAEEAKDDRVFRTAPASPERTAPEESLVTQEDRPESYKESSAPSLGDRPQSDHIMDTEMATAESSEETSDEEGMDLDEEDFAQSKAKFERQKAHLESQMIDLSARQYRATTPLEQIAKLARITAHDLPSPETLLSPEGKDVVMQESEVPQPAASPSDAASARDQNDLEPDLLTPKQEQIEEAEPEATSQVETAVQTLGGDRIIETAEADEAEDIVMNGSDELDSITPEPKQSIEAITLPYLAKAPLTPLSELGAYHENLARQNAVKPALIIHYQAQAEEEKSVQRDLHDEYLERYRGWRLETQLLDRERASKESEERQMSVELGLDLESSPILENPISESRSRLHKFSSEYDFEKVLKESEETARLEQEKLDRESRRAQIDLEKEAIMPDVWDAASREKNVFKNMNRYRDPICLTEIYGYEPAIDTFTEAEHKRFLDLFKERPKKWGEIAAQLPGRTYADCIHHYYKYKWDGRFKEKVKRKGKGGGRGRGGKSGVSRARAAPLMADLSKGEEDSSSGPMLTETGRPRRAATRTAYTAEKDPEAKPVSTTAGTGKKAISGIDVGAEKPAKRRKTTAAGEKAPKRGRQSLVSAAASVTSPAGVDKDVALSKEELARAQNLEDASLLAGLSAGHRNVTNSQSVEYAHEAFPVHNAGEAAERSRAPAQASVQRSSASSYWSVPEQTDFVKFIAHFGTDFGAIANHMGTKTQTMVKNYYQRLVESGNRPDVVEAANVANARRERGEDMGVPPTPTPINKRRYDNPGPALPRTASGSQGEVMDIDPIPPTQPATAQQPSSQFQHQYRFSMSTQPTSAPTQRVVPTPLQPNASPALSKPSIPAQPRASQASGPKMGFFSESRLERRPTLQSSERPVQQPSPSLMHQQQPTPPSVVQQNLSHLTSEFVKNLKEEQQRALSIQKRASQEHVPQVAHHPLFQPHSAQTSAPNASPQLSMLERPIEREDRSGTPGLSSLANSRGGSAMFRNILGSPGPIPSPPVAMHPPFRSAHVPSPPKREDYRPGSVPAPSPAPSVVKPVLPSLPAPPAEPRKTSNLASLLNSEPEEPRPKKRVSEQGMPPFTQSPTPSVLSVAPSGPSTSIYPPRREVFNQTPSSRQEFEARPVYPQPTSHAPTPSVQHEHMAGRSGTPVSGRQSDWGSRPSMAQNLTSSSPHPPTPLEREVRPYFSHRANLAGLNQQSRSNPSPPPNAHPYMTHSRTPSLGGRPMTPSQMQSQGSSVMPHMAPAQTSQAQPQLMQPGLYGGPSHLQQIQAHQKNQFHHRHNSSGGSSQSGLHQRQPSRGEEMMRQQQQQQQEREFHINREREHRMEVDRQYKEREAQFQAQQHQQQEHQRYAQHRAAQPFPPQPLSAQPFVSLREQARIEADQSYRDARDRERYEQEMHNMRARMQQEEEERMRYDYRGPSNMMGRSSAGGYGGFPPPPHRR